MCPIDRSSFLPRKRPRVATERLVTTDPKIASVVLPPVIANAVALDRDKGLKEASTIDEWFQALSDWAAARPVKPETKTVGNPKKTNEKHGGIDYEVTRTPYSLTDTAAAIVSFEPVNGFWLGGLVQENGLSLGLTGIREIGVEKSKRASFTISSDLSMANNYRVVNEPSKSSVSSAIASLIQGSARGGGAQNFEAVDNYSEEQVAYELGMNASYLGASLKGAFKSNRSRVKNSITAVFIERAFTLQADFEGRTRRKAFFNDMFTVEDARSLTAQGAVSNGNLPGYVKSITYGRIVVFTMSSTLSEEAMGTSVEARADAKGFGVKTGGVHSNELQETTFDLRVTMLGGERKSFSPLITSVSGFEELLKVMNGHLAAEVPLSTMVPISYTINTLRDGQLMKLARTTEYVVEEFSPMRRGEKYKIKMWVKILKSDDGPFDNTLECYGMLRMNGETWWSIPRGQSVRKEKGHTLDISESMVNNKKNDTTFTVDHYFDQSPIIDLDLQLMDRDSGSSDDAIGKFRRKLDIREMATSGKTHEWDWDSKNGEATRLFIRVERIAFL